MRVVLDTNIVISAYLGDVSEEVLEAFKSGKFTLIVSTAIVDEYFKVLRRPKFRITRDGYYDFASLLIVKAEFVIPLEVVTIIEDDPSDNKFLEAALQGKVDFVVSGDNHLLALKYYRDIPIITSREFIELL